MFSKQADPRGTNNKSSKTASKKRNKPLTNNNNSVTVTTTTTTTTPNNKKNNKSRKTKRDSQTKPDLIEDIKQASSPPDKNVDLVVLRNTPDDNRKNENLKRYSDSFVLGDDTTKKIEPPKLSRAASGFIFTEDEKLERKSRRFSDIFKYGALKSYNSCDNLKILPRTMEAASDEIDGVVLREKSEVVFKVPAEKKKEASQVTNTNNSYLKRVKSKIYKNKNDGVVSNLPTMPDISENTCKTTTKKIKNKKNNEIKESCEEPIVKRGTFDFRLIRQTSNLERIRPRSFAPKKCIELNNDNNSAVVQQEKPILVKSKSSSAISLNLLRTRRNKILEQVKNRNCKVVENEFDFIPFGNSLRSSQRLYGSQTLNNNVVDVTKLTGWMNDSESGKFTKNYVYFSLLSIRLLIT